MFHQISTFSGGKVIKQLVCRSTNREKCAPSNIFRCILQQRSNRCDRIMSVEWVILDIGGEKFHAKESVIHLLLYKSRHWMFCFRRRYFLSFPAPGLERWWPLLMLIRFWSSVTSTHPAALHNTSLITILKRLQVLILKSWSYIIQVLIISGVLEMYRSGQFHIPDGSRACA